MNHDQLIGIIKECLRLNTEDEKGEYDSVVRAVNVYVPGEACKSCSDGSYKLNMDTVTILDHFHRDRGQPGEYDYETGVVFSFDLGYGFAHSTISGDYTFSREECTLNIIESNDWDQFERMVLTDDARDALRNLIAEMRLLRGDE